MIHQPLIVIAVVSSRFLKRYSKASSPGHQLIHERCDESKGVSKGGVKSSGPISRIPEGDRVAVKVGVDKMGRVNDQMDQGRSV